jgi:hypothetical protein
MFNEALKAYGGSVKGVRGTWLGGGELSSNFDAYKANIKAGMEPPVAAKNTFTGTMASRAGFTKARIVVDTKSKVVVEFLQ